MHKMRKVRILFTLVFMISLASVYVYAENVTQKKTADKISAEDGQTVEFSVKVQKPVGDVESKVPDTAKAKTVMSQQAIDQQIVECKSELKEIVKDAETSLKKIDEESKAIESDKAAAKHLNAADMFFAAGKLVEAKKEYGSAMAMAGTPSMKTMIKDKERALDEQVKQIELQNRKAAQEAADKAKLEARKRAEEEASTRKAAKEKSAAEKKAAEEKRVSEKKAAQEAAKQAKLEAKKKAEEEMARKKAEKEMAKRKAEEEIAKKRAEEEMARKKAEEEKAAKKAEKEMAKKKAEEEIARKKAEKEMARKRAEEEMAAKKAAEEIARQKATQESAAKIQGSPAVTAGETAGKASGSVTDRIIASLPEASTAAVQAPSGYERPAPVPPSAAGEEVSAMYREAVALYWDGKYSEARMKFEQVQKASPEYARTNYYLGRVKEKLNK
ncbi:MAG: hypothetical protein NTY76_03050 [Candidatus Omnitrophica bacterium]|nr:hypothetical protein [Candidatus Omnitrophota bacterium]